MGAGVGKCCQVKVAGERVFIGHLECVQESEGCMIRMLKGFFLLLNLINYNYFLRKSICKTPFLVIKAPNVFFVFCFVFKRFCLTFKVDHVHEFIIYVILYLFDCYICYFHVNCACYFIYLYDCTFFLPGIYVCICVSLPHTKGEYPFTKIFVLVKEIKETY